MSSPTLCAAPTLWPSTPLTTSSSVEAEHSVWPIVSSTTWATMWRLERVTTSRGRSGVPLMRLRTRWWRILRAMTLDLPLLIA